MYIVNKSDSIGYAFLLQNIFSDFKTYIGNYIFVAKINCSEVILSYYFFKQNK